MLVYHDLVKNKKKIVLKNKNKKPIKKNKSNIVILDTNIFSVIYTKPDERDKITIKKLLEKLNAKQKNNELYITKSIKSELDRLYIDNDRETLQKIWHEFQDNILKNSYDHIDQINQICKIVTDEVKELYHAKNKIERNKEFNQLKYDNAKEEFEKYLPKWKNGETNFSFYPVLKNYEVRKEINELGKQNEDYLLIEGPDRIILSTAVFYAKTGKNVSLYTRDVGILYLSKKMKELSVTIQGIYPKWDIFKKYNYSGIKNQGKSQSTSHITMDEYDEMEDKLLDKKY